MYFDISAGTGQLLTIYNYSKQYVQIFLPHLLGVLRSLSCSYFENCGNPVTTDLAARITTLPDLLTRHRAEYESGVVLKRHDADPVSPTLEKEALSAVSAAQSYRQNGNFKKVYKEKD